jgi:hypothetical protein
MKKLLIVFLILSSYLSFGQVTPVKTVKVTSSDILFTENIPKGTIIIDTGSGQVYLTLLPLLANMKTITSCTITEIKQIDDQIISLTPLTGVSIGGAYPSFTITNTGGTVTSVTGTAPIVATVGNIPVISMAASTTSVPGYLTAADWTTFNSKQPAVQEVADEITYAGPPSLNLTKVPSEKSIVKMYINGVRISNKAYSIIGLALTYDSTKNGAYSLVIGDRIQFDYFY